MAITVAGIKSVPIVGSFISGIFKRPARKDGYRRYTELWGIPKYNSYRRIHSWFNKSMHVPPLPMTVSEKSKACKQISTWVINWTKAQKEDVRKTLAGIKVIPTPPPPAPPEVHTVSASSLQLGQTAVIKKSGEIIQAGISKIPIYVFVGIGALLLLPQLLRTRGGKE